MDTNLHTLYDLKDLSVRDFLYFTLYARDQFMKTQEIEQIKNILLNIENAKKSIPYLSNLEQHAVF